MDKIKTKVEKEVMYGVTMKHVKKMLDDGLITKEQYKEMEKRFRTMYDQEFGIQVDE